MKTSPKQHPIAELQREAVYVVKRGDAYADGLYNWVTRQKLAFRFFDETYAYRKTMLGKDWALAHIAWIGDPMARVVRLVPKVKP